MIRLSIYKEYEFLLYSLDVLNWYPLKLPVSLKILLLVIWNSLAGDDVKHKK